MVGKPTVTAEASCGGEIKADVGALKRRKQGAGEILRKIVAVMFSSAPTREVSGTMYFKLKVSLSSEARGAPLSAAMSLPLGVVDQWQILLALISFYSRLLHLVVETVP